MSSQKDWEKRLKEIMTTALFVRSEIRGNIYKRIIEWLYKPLLDFFRQELALARQEGEEAERNRWLHQSANEHDKRIRQEERKEFINRIEEHLPGLCGTVHCDDEECVECDGMNKLMKVIKSLSPKR